ncbi:hypothetical protein NC651_003852 [Populus alba x Populus x berolinensis]|nr:hypothetical protein NC651_003852 [Populus alba x Populus x berolinensis]
MQTFSKSSKSLMLDNPKSLRGYRQLMLSLYGYSLSFQHFHILGISPKIFLIMCMHMHSNARLCSPSKRQRCQSMPAMASRGLYPLNLLASASLAC